MVALINGKNSINKYILFYLEVVGGAPLVRAATVSCRRGGVDPAPKAAESRLDGERNAEIMPQRDGGHNGDIGAEPEKDLPPRP
jgi:hypothetical protein